MTERRGSEASPAVLPVHGTYWSRVRLPVLGDLAAVRSLLVCLGSVVIRTMNGSLRSVEIKDAGAPAR
ncbi:hypothetical protein ABT116_24445 [Streptomyces sp. NPDC002130]|uniref:hypothetical protein n=1 Tax=Streptomyces sp. NPDC002130 TaxID=3155568 RepID=UPI00332B545E